MKNKGETPRKACIFLIKPVYFLFKLCPIIQYKPLHSSYNHFDILSAASSWQGKQRKRNKLAVVMWDAGTAKGPAHNQWALGVGGSTAKAAEEDANTLKNKQTKPCSN